MNVSSKLAVVLGHVAFENLGAWEEILQRRGLAIRYIDACIDPLDDVDVTAPDLLVVLGGPISAYEDATYPRVVHEVELMRRRLEARQPLLGICLGAQMMARALGARVYPGPVKEIGWKPLHLTDAGRAGCMSALGEGEMMLHWHGDTFDLPAGCTHLAYTREVPNQAFAVENFGLAVQCHPEVRACTFERWLMGHACELAANHIDIPGLRRETALRGPDLERRGAQLFECWLERAGL
jgi:GMP synthase (glutamine-hydrolysing)